MSADNGRYFAQNFLGGKWRAARRFERIEAAVGWLSEYGGGAVSDRVGSLGVLCIVPCKLCTREWPPKGPDRVKAERTIRAWRSEGPA